MIIMYSNGNAFLVRGMEKEAVRSVCWISVYLPGPEEWRDQAVGLEGAG